MENKHETNPPTQTVGDIMKESHQRALKRLVILAGIGVYLAGVVYAEVHGFSILSKGVNPDFLIWAYLGMIALGITAITLPIALHVWTFESMHRIAALAFYVVDLALLGTNSFVDFSVNVGEALPQWAQVYADFIMPATPVICAIGWSILFLLDPSTRAMILSHTLRASIREALGQQIVQAAKGENVTAAVGAAAQAEVDKSLSDLFGRNVWMIDRRRNYEQTVPHPTDAAKAAALAEAKALGMWNPNDPKDTPFERSRPDVHKALTQAEPSYLQTYGPEWENSEDISPTLDAYAWVCLKCDGHSPAYTRKCQWCQQPRINKSPITAFANLPPASKSPTPRPADNVFPMPQHDQEDQPETGSPFPGSES